jgi:NADH oxidase (H2O-forming)
MPNVTLAPDVYCVGVKDPGLTVFDIVIPTEHGTTYNSYLVKGKEKTALIDCVKRPFAGEFFRRIEEILPVEKIDYLVINHSEPDHAGGIVDLLERHPNVQVYFSRAAKSFIDNLVNGEYKFHIVGDDEELPLGGKTLRFINAPFLHWPDTIFTYLVEDKILFPCDFLGSHYSSPHTFNDELDQPEKARKAFEFYYSTIMRPYKEPVLKACARLKDLPISIIAPSHGPVLRKNPLEYVAWYKHRADIMARVKEKKVPIIYVSAYGNTAAMAKKVADGVAAGGLTPVLLNGVEVPIDKIVDELDESVGFLIGTPTLNSNLPHPILSMIGHLVVLNLRGKTASAFGSYGWSGEAIKMVADILTAMRIKVSPEPIKFKMTPSAQELDTCFEFGKKFAVDLVGQA